MKKSLSAAITVVAFAFGGSAPMSAQQSSEAPATSQGVNREILKELKEIHELLLKLSQPPQQRPRSATVRLPNGISYVLGSPDAPLTMIEFSDLECPYCRQFASTTFGEIKKNWIDTGKLRYIAKDFPLDIHPNAMAAARAARCAGEQKKYWDMRLALVRNGNLLSTAFISRTAAEMGLDAKAFDQCTASTKYDPVIEADQAETFALGVDGTPSFVIGKTAGGTVEGSLTVGALPYATFDAQLQELFERNRK